MAFSNRYDGFGPKTDVTLAIFSHNFVARVFSRDKVASVTWRVARVFNSRATLFPNRALLYSMQLCLKDDERWLLSSCHLTNITACSELREVLFLTLWLLFVYEVYREPLNGLWAKFTRMTCLVSRSDEVEGQDQRSKFKVTTDKNGIFRPFGPSALIAVISVGVWQLSSRSRSAACVRLMFGQTSLDL